MHTRQYIKYIHSTVYYAVYHALLCVIVNTKFRVWDFYMLQEKLKHDLFITVDLLSTFFTRLL